MKSEEHSLVFGEEDEDDIFQDYSTQFVDKSNIVFEEDDDSDFTFPENKIAFEYEDEDESFDLVISKQNTSLSEFVTSEEEELIYYVDLIDRQRSLKGSNKMTSEGLTDDLYKFIKARLVVVYPGCDYTFSSPTYKKSQNMLEFIRSNIMFLVTSYDETKDEKYIFNFNEFYKLIFAILIHERIKSQDNHTLATNISEVGEVAHNHFLNMYKASISISYDDIVNPVYPKSIYPSGYLCDCGNFQKTKYPLPSVLSNNSGRVVFLQEEIQCGNCRRDIVVPKDVVFELTKMVEDNMYHPKVSKDTYFIYRPPLHLMTVPYSLSDVVFLEEYEEDEVEPDDNTVYTSLFKELVNNWTRESLCDNEPLDIRLFNSKSFHFDIEQEWRNWSATVVYYLENNGVFMLTPWAEPKYMYTKQEHMSHKETVEYLNKNFHWIAGIRTVMSVKESPVFTSDVVDTMRNIFMYRCFVRTNSWSDKIIKDITTKSEISLNILPEYSKNKFTNVAVCTKGRAKLQDSNVLPSVKVFEDYNTLKSVVNKEKLQESCNLITPKRERFNEFKILLNEESDTIFGTSMTDLYTVRRVQILKVLSGEYGLAEKPSPSFENYKCLVLGEDRDYVLWTYLCMSDNIPQNLLYGRDIGISAVEAEILTNRELKTDLDLININWRTEL